MIKLNLLPQYIGERRKIRIAIVWFVVLLALEAGVLFKALGDMKAQADWFVKDKPYYENYKKTIDASAAAAAEWEGKSGTYDPYNAFFQGEAVTNYNNELIKAIAAAAAKVASGRAWYTEFKVTGTDVAANGQVKGLMNFLNFYYDMTGAGATVTPVGGPQFYSASNPTSDVLKQVVGVEVKATSEAGIPAPPDPGIATQTWQEILVPAAPAAAPAGGVDPFAAPPM